MSLHADLLNQAEHSEMKNAAKAFAGGTLRDSLSDRIGIKTIPDDLRRVAQSFLDLQEARHDADYDLSRTFTKRAAQMTLRNVRSLLLWYK